MKPSPGVHDNYTISGKGSAGNEKRCATAACKTTNWELFFFFLLPGLDIPIKHQLHFWLLLLQHFTRWVGGGLRV